MDKRPDLLALSLRNELIQMLQSIKDEGSEIDTGGGGGSEDMWVTVGGVEFVIQVHWPKLKPEKR
jgi:hypothetical protein